MRRRSRNSRPRRSRHEERIAAMSQPCPHNHTFWTAGPYPVEVCADCGWPVIFHYDEAVA